jgi:transglutaminase-like putative cysteine protease
LATRSRCIPIAVLLIVSAPIIFSCPAFAAPSWQQPTAEELSMTSQPETPGADAVYLNREETTDDRGNSVGAMEGYTELQQNFHTLYVRLKVLTEAGKKYADVRIIYPGRAFSVDDVQGRTIHSDGTITPLTNKPFKSTVEKTKMSEETGLVFTMPDVQVGSILEYRYVLRYNGRILVAPEWYIQQELFLRSAKYSFRAYSGDTVNSKGNLSIGVAYTNTLPKGTEVKYIPSRDTYELEVHNISPVPSEEFSMPPNSLKYRVLFYYTGYHSPQDFWADEGRDWSKDVNRFASSSKLKDAVAQIVGATDSDQQKLNKIYDAVMQLENTNFTREHTQAENRASGIKTKTAEDIWEQKRGNAEEITLLFIAMARAAGLKAYAMKVTDRDTQVFDMNFLSMYQLGDVVAIVQVDGKEQYFDPGERYCAFAQLHWRHTVTDGIRQTDAGTSLAKTPGAVYTAAQTLRIAKLQLDADGKLHGLVTIKMAGVPALYWRQKALESDEAAVTKEFEDSLRGIMAPGVELKTSRFVGLADWKTVLQVQLEVSGSMGTSTSKRVFLPSNFFEAGSKPLFTHEKRQAAVYLQYASEVQDSVTLELPKNLAVESVPKDAKIPFPNNALYAAQYAVKDNTYTLGRAFILANFMYLPNDYAGLKDFYQKITAQDQEQLILSANATGSGQ